MESKKSIGDKLRAPQLERINFEKCEIASTSMEKVAAAADNLHNLVSENVQVNTRKTVGAVTSEICTDSVVDRQNDSQEKTAAQTKINQKEEPEKKYSSSILHNQVQCVNLHCQSGFDLTEAPVFVLIYYGVNRKKNVLQKVCRECFFMALDHQDKLSHLLKNDIPLLTSEFPKIKDDVVVMDTVDEIYEEKVLPEFVISVVEEQLEDLISNVVEKYDIEFQLKSAEEILCKKYDNLAEFGNKINAEINVIESSLKKVRKAIYNPFAPVIKSISPLNLIDSVEQKDQFKQQRATKTVAEVVKECQLPHSPSLTSVKPSVSMSSGSEGYEIVALAEVEIPKVKLPPFGKLAYPPLQIGSPVFVAKGSVSGVWIKVRIVEIVKASTGNTSCFRVRLDVSHRGGFVKTVTRKQMAYGKPSKVRYPVGTRVIALFRNMEGIGKNAYYAGIVAEPLKILNGFRYLIFFDDGYAQYVTHENIYLVCESSKYVHEDVHSDNREFIKTYLTQYPERPMVRLQKSQTVRTERNGIWCSARVEEVDGSLVKVNFESDNKKEWIYRGSTRLGPLYSEFVAVAARKEQGALSRHRSLGIASLKKRNMPYVEYSVDSVEQYEPKSPSSTRKNVAKKSTASKSSVMSETLPNSNYSLSKSNNKNEYVTRGYIREMKLPGRIRARIFVGHQCGPSCLEWTKFSPGECKGLNPLAIPLLYGFERETARYKSKRSVFYRGPCGRRLRNIVEMHYYLQLTNSLMQIDYFDFEYRVRALHEFHLEPFMYCTYLKDISYGCENVPVSCVNEISHEWPSFMEYSTSRIPQVGVNICLDEDFLVCCSCTDDCQDKKKCECWQLTIEGTKLSPDGKANPNVGYHYKRLLDPVTTGIYECNKRCKCSKTCLNRVVQHPLQLNLQVFNTKSKGWGLRTINDIPQGGFICIYAGRLHTEQSANDDGRKYGDEYLAELDYIEVVERFKEGYESEVVDPEGEKNNESERDEDGDDSQDRQDDQDDGQFSNDDGDYIPEGLNRVPHGDNVVNTRGRNKKATSEINMEGRKEPEKEQDNECMGADDDEDEIKKTPSKFTAEVPVAKENSKQQKSVREMYGDGADDCYVMDAKSNGNIGRYLNHSCQPNVFVQNVFVDTHDVRFPWVAFFALTHIKAGSELTWDYNYDVGSVPDKVLYCYCNSAECRGRLL